ncbi:MAG: FG-GAP-like repeat-containing protein [Pirellulaceae bacterium]
MMWMIGNPSRFPSQRLLGGFLLAMLCGCVERDPAPPVAARSPASPTAPAASVAAAPQPDSSAQPQTPLDRFALLGVFNRGCALMEQYRYTEAAKLFLEVVEAQPEWPAARFNLGLAYLNMLGMEGAQANPELAREQFQKILAADPRNPHAHYCLGMLSEHLRETEQAAAHYKVVAEVDPEDPHVLHKYGLALIDAGKVDEGMALLEKSIEIDPGMNSSIYRLALLYRRKGDIQKAKELLERFEALKSAEMTGGTFAIAKVYGSAGKYYKVLDADSLPRDDSPGLETSPVVFSPAPRTFDARIQAWHDDRDKVARPLAAAGDIDGDGDLDLCLGAMGDDGAGTLWINDGTGHFRHGDDVATRGTSASFGDVDNDGDLDLWIGRAGVPSLLLNDGAGKFSPSPYTNQPLDSPGLTTCARLIDVDSDGDLDLLAFRASGGSLPVDESTKPAASLVFNNNRDGSYEEIAERLGLQLPDYLVGTVVHDDFDNDLDLDMIAFPASAGETRVWVNDRAWQHRVLGAPLTGLDSQRVVGATSADVNKDGWQDLLVFADDQVHLFRNEGRFHFARDAEFAAQFSALGGTNGQVVDVDNDGDLDLLIADARRQGSRGPVLLLNDRGTGKFHKAADLDAGFVLSTVETGGDAACLAADFTGHGRCDILLLPVGEAPVLFENLTSGAHWIALDLQGVRPQDKMGRSNNSAIGARVEIKTGTILQQFTVGVPTGPSVAPPLRIHAGLGPFEKVDWLRIYWPDAVLQAELELPGNQVTKIEELPRKTSSCPTLFAWDGSRYRFVADFAGVGGLGFFLSPGRYATPDPTEYLPIPVLEPQDGEYVLQVLEPLEEVVYFDEAKLVAVDHPLGTEVWPHEMMPVNCPPPPFELFGTREKIEAVHAVNHEGTDVTGRLAAVDRQYAGATQIDPRFLGFAAPHYVELDFAERLKDLAPNARLVMYLFGWVEYGYSSTNFAAYQANMSLRAPTIQVQRDGRWVDVLTEVGYPAGLQHMMTVDVTGAILPGDRRIRVASNMELYWDRIYLGVAEELPLRVQEVPVTSASLAFFGYPREYSPDGLLPNLYDYQNIDRVMGWKLMNGDYTRYGEVGELLSEPDDCYVIMDRGEQLTLRFPVEAFGPVPAGQRRTFLLKTDAYCKDMDLYTAFPDTVEPLPFHGMSGYPYAASEAYPNTAKTREYREKYNTRRVGK